MTVTVNALPSNGPSILLQINGRLDSRNADDFYGRCHELTAAGQRSVIVDASRLDYISSAGLRLCIALAQDCQRNGRQLVVCGLPKEPRELFSISGIDQVIPVCPDLPAAVALLEGQRPSACRLRT